MKKIYLFILFFLIAMGITHNITYGQSVTKDADSTKLKPVYSNETKTDSYFGLQKYFLEQELKFSKKYPSYLYSISHENTPLPDPDSKYFRITGEYLLQLNTFNFGLAYSPSWFENNSPWKFYVGPRIWVGTKSSAFILKKDTTNPKEYAKVNSMLGIEGEVELRLTDSDSRFKASVYGGIGVSMMANEGFEKSKTETVENNGSAIDLFFGPRFVLTSKSGVALNLQARVGTLYTNSIEHLDGTAFYYGFGASITSLQAMSRTSSVNFMKLESGLYYSPMSNTAFGQLTQPIRLLPNVSVGVNFQVGTGVGESITNKKRVSAFWGIGADLRFFANQTTPFLNPYTGFIYQSFGYQDNSGFVSNGISQIRVGDRVRLGEYSNWYIDVNVGVPIKTNENFVKFNGSFIKQPMLFDFNFGLIYKIRVVEEKNTDAYEGRIEFYAEDDIRKLSSKEFDPLPPNAIGDILAEKRIYIQGKEAPAPPPEAVPPNIDVADVKVLRFDYITNSSVSMPKNVFNIKNQPQDTLVLLVAMFDKKRTDVTKLENKNMSLVFNDFIESRYFGFTYDINQRLQPETRHIYKLQTGPKNAYYGNFKEYVKNLRWLDSDNLELKINKIDGKEVERDILRYFDDFNIQLSKESSKNGKEPFYITKENYRFAYAIYPLQTMQNVSLATNGKYGLSLMFKYDLNRNNKNDSVPIGYVLNKQGDFEIDNGDATFFSNIIQGFDSYQPTEKKSCDQTLTIDNFDLGKSNISQANSKKLAQAAKLSVACSGRVTVIKGYTDKVEFAKNAKILERLKDKKDDPIVKSCFSLNEERALLISEWDAMMKKNSNGLPSDDLCQRALAWFRIHAALSELQDWGADIANVNTNAIGIIDDPDNETYNPNARKVEITFE